MANGKIGKFCKWTFVTYKDRTFVGKTVFSVKKMNKRIKSIKQIERRKTTPPHTVQDYPQTNATLENAAKFSAHPTVTVTRLEHMKSEATAREKEDVAPVAAVTTSTTGLIEEKPNQWAKLAKDARHTTARCGPKPTAATWLPRNLPILSPMRMLRQV